MGDRHLPASAFPAELSQLRVSSSQAPSSLSPALALPSSLAPSPPLLFLRPVYPQSPSISPCPPASWARLPGEPWAEGGCPTEAGRTRASHLLASPRSFTVWTHLWVTHGVSGHVAGSGESF